MSGVFIANLIELEPHTLLDQVSLVAALAMLRAKNDAPVYLFAGREQLDPIRPWVAANSPVTHLMEVPYMVLFSAQGWWLQGYQNTVVGG